jgi:Outer membrane protein beta-barrel domain
MKKVLLGLIALTGITVLNAQTQQGDWMVGGNFRLNTSDNNTQIAFTPNVGAFVIDNLALGGNINLSYSKSGNNKYTSFGFGPFARYYFTTQNQTVRPIVQGSFSYLSTKSKIGNTTSSTNTGSNYFIGGGAAMFISNNVSIDALMGYDHTKYKSFNGSGGFAFNIGFQVYINKGQMEKVAGKKK